MNAIKQEIKVNGKDLPILLICQLAAWLFGVVMVVVILALDKTETTYFNMGMLMSLIVAAFGAVVYDGFGFQLRYQLALSMSCTRKTQLAVNTVLCFLRILILVGTAWVLGRLEILLYEHVLFPKLTMDADFSFYMIYQAKYLLPAAAALTVFSLLMSAFFGKFGRKGGLVLYFAGLGTFFLSMRVLDAMDDAPESLLGRFGTKLGAVFGSMSVAVWGILGSVTLIVLLVVSLRMLLRQAVQY